MNTRTCILPDVNTYSTKIWLNTESEICKIIFPKTVQAVNELK